MLDYDAVLKQIQGARPCLLLGNGFSCSVHDGFRYESLFQFARDSGLPPSACELFDNFGTTDFERVMRLLEDSQWIADHYDLLDSSHDNRISEDLEKVREALIYAISHTHPPHIFCLSDQNKTSCLKFLSSFHDVYSLNYDLLLYWVYSSSQALKVDGFGFPNSDDTNPSYLVLSQPRDVRPWLFHLHGALHLYTVEGETRKHRYQFSQRPLIEVICEGIQHSEYPLFVAEGSSKQKLKQISGNVYLSLCFQEFKRATGALVCYGVSFGESDSHISHAISDNPQINRLFVGLYGNPEAPENLITRAAVRQLVDRRRTRVAGSSPLEVSYFNSESASVWTAD